MEPFTATILATSRVWDAGPAVTECRMLLLLLHIEISSGKCCFVAFTAGCAKLLGQFQHAHGQAYTFTGLQPMSLRINDAEIEHQVLGMNVETEEQLLETETATCIHSTLGRASSHKSLHFTQSCHQNETLTQEALVSMLALSSTELSYSLSSSHTFVINYTGIATKILDADLRIVEMDSSYQVFLGTKSLLSVDELLHRTITFWNIHVLANSNAIGDVLFACCEYTDIEVDCAMNQQEISPFLTNMPPDTVFWIFELKKLLVNKWNVDGCCLDDQFVNFIGSKLGSTDTGINTFLNHGTSCFNPAVTQSGIPQIIDFENVIEAVSKVSLPVALQKDSTLSCLTVDHYSKQSLFAGADFITIAALQVDKTGQVYAYDGVSRIGAEISEKWQLSPDDYNYIYIILNFVAVLEVATVCGKRYTEMRYLQLSRHDLVKVCMMNKEPSQAFTYDHQNENTLNRLVFVKQYQFPHLEDTLLEYQARLVGASFLPATNEIFEICLSDKVDVIVDFVKDSIPSTVQICAGHWYYMRLPANVQKMAGSTMHLRVSRPAQIVKVSINSTSDANTTCEISLSLADNESRLHATRLEEEYQFTHKCYSIVDASCLDDESLPLIKYFEGAISSVDFYASRQPDSNTLRFLKVALKDKTQNQLGCTVDLFFDADGFKYPRGLKLDSIVTVIDAHLWRNQNGRVCARVDSFTGIELSFGDSQVTTESTKTDLTGALPMHLAVLSPASYNIYFFDVELLYLDSLSMRWACLTCGATVYQRNCPNNCVSEESTTQDPTLDVARLGHRFVARCECTVTDGTKDANCLLSDPECIFSLLQLPMEIVHTFKDTVHAGGVFNYSESKPWDKQERYDPDDIVTDLKVYAYPGQHGFPVSAESQLNSELCAKITYYCEPGSYRPFRLFGRSATNIAARQSDKNIFVESNIKIRDNITKTVSLPRITLNAVWIEQWREAHIVESTEVTV